VPALRRARPADAKAIAAIYNDGIAERQSTFETAPRRAEDIEAWLAAGPRLPVLVAGEGDGRVVGWARIAPYSERPAYAGVGEVSVYVDRAARGRGIGRRLLEELAVQASELDYWKLTGKVFPENAASLALIRRCGWREVGLHLRHGRLDGEWRDVMVVERLLETGQAPAPDDGAASPGA
jgi:L-amino acid N-acyltransferase YncA